MNRKSGENAKTRSSKKGPSDPVFQPKTAKDGSRNKHAGRQDVNTLLPAIERAVQNQTTIALAEPKHFPEYDAEKRTHFEAPGKLEPIALTDQIRLYSVNIVADGHPGYCFFASLALIARKVTADQGQDVDAEDALGAALAKATHNGHSLDTIESVCKKLDLPHYSISELTELCKRTDLINGYEVDERPPLPGVVLAPFKDGSGNGHVMLVTTSQSLGDQKVLLYERIEWAFRSHGNPELELNAPTCKLEKTAKFRFQQFAKKQAARAQKPKQMILGNSFQKRKREYAQKIAHFREGDLPQIPDPEEQQRFWDLFAALTEASDCGAKHLKPTNFALLCQGPLPQDRNQFICARSMFKSIRHDYQEVETTEVTVRRCTEACYAGKRNCEVPRLNKPFIGNLPRRETSVTLDFNVDLLEEMFDTLKSSVTVHSTLVAGIKPDISAQQMLCLHTSNDRIVTLGDQFQYVENPVETSVARNGTVTMVPAPQAPLQSCMLGILQRYFSADVLARINRICAQNGGHAHLAFIRTLLQSRVTSACQTQSMKASVDGQDVLVVEIGSKAISVSNSWKYVQSRWLQQQLGRNGPQMRDILAEMYAPPQRGPVFDSLFGPGSTNVMMNAWRMMPPHQRPQTLFGDIIIHHVRPTSGESNLEGAVENILRPDIARPTITRGTYDEAYHAQASESDRNDALVVATIQDYHYMMQFISLVGQDLLDFAGALTDLAARRPMPTLDDWIDDNLAQLLQDTVFQHWPAIKPIIADLPRIIRAFRNGLQIKFVAKDSHYYYATDPAFKPESMTDEARKLPGSFALWELNGRLTTMIDDLEHTYGNMANHWSSEAIGILQNLRGSVLHNSLDWEGPLEFYAKGARLYAQGMWFTTIPGYYQFFSNEGHFVNDAFQRITMFTRSNGTPYVHNNLQPSEQTMGGQKVIDFGYVKFFAFDGLLSAFNWYMPMQWPRTFKGTALKIGTSPLDVYLVQVHRKINQSKPMSSYELRYSEICGRIERAGITEDYFTQAALAHGLQFVTKHSKLAFNRDGDFDRNALGDIAARAVSAYRTLICQRTFDTVVGQYVRFEGHGGFKAIFSDEAVYDVEVPILCQYDTGYLDHVDQRPQDTAALQQTELTALHIPPEYYSGPKGPLAVETGTSDKEKRENFRQNVAALAERNEVLLKAPELAPLMEELDITCDSTEIPDALAARIRDSWAKLKKPAITPVEGLYLQECSGYYWVKPVDFDEIDWVNPEVLIADEADRTRQTLRNLRNLAEQWPMPCDIRRDEIVPADEAVKRPFFKTLAGANVVRMESGEPIETHEYDTKSFQNLVYAVTHRQLGARTSPDPQHLVDFADMCRRWMDTWVHEVVDYFEPALATDYIEKQPQFSREKKLKYAKYFTSSLYDPSHVDFVGDFVPMVKGGEVYPNTLSEAEAENGFRGKTSDRPRAIFAPSDYGCGPMQAYQSSLFPRIKEALPSFIHSMKSSEIVDLVTSKIQLDYRAISIDGSAFDSTQYAALQEIVENEFFRRTERCVEEWCERQLDGLIKAKSPETYSSQLKRSLLKTDNVFYMPAPGINDQPWSSEELKRYRRHTKDLQEAPWENVARLRLNGTTFSGLSTRTTLGNTLRSIAYMYYYIERAGIPEPWNDDRIFVIASGDDTVCWSHPALATAIVQSIERHTARTGSRESQIGLGQIVKTVSNGKFHEIDFCSKKSFCLDGAFTGWYLTRDLKKVLVTKQHATSRNLNFLFNPAVYLGATLYALRLEKLSKLVEDMRTISLHKLTGGAEVDESLLYQACAPYLPYLANCTDTGYECEAQINADLGICNCSLFELMQTNTVYAGPMNVLAPQREELRERSLAKTYPKHKNGNEKKFCPGKWTPNTRTLVVENSMVTVTTELCAALRFFNGYQPRLDVVVDNEADTGFVNAMIVCVPTARRVLLFHGPSVYHEQWYVYQKLEQLGARCYAWGGPLEKDYPNLIDLQQRYALLSQTQGYQGPALAKVACQNGLPAKSECGDYRLYTQNTLEDPQIVYAVRDVLLPEMIRTMFAPAKGFHRVVRCGHLDYRLTRPQADALPPFKRDFTWCPSPQTMTYSELQRRISDSAGQEMVICDFGASSDMTRYERSGVCCVAQSVCFAALATLWIAGVKEKMLQKALASPMTYNSQMAQNGVPLGTVLDKVSKRGAALEQITAILNPIDQDHGQPVRIWTPSTPDGKLDVGNQTAGKATINLVVQDFHAMIALPALFVKKIDPKRYRLPQDCKHACWNAYATSDAKKLHAIAAPIDRCNRGVFYDHPLLARPNAGLLPAYQHRTFAHYCPQRIVQNDWIASQKRSKPA